MAEQIRTALAILRLKQVKAVTGLSRSTIYARQKNGSFPPSLALGPRAVGWRLSAIEEFLADPAGYRAEPA
ncbi:AlpA family transcriptional regulator [Paraburkholderia phytofirmans OLGA172]|uniref:AlpA family transcriptional regulator n=1 Tax=Paraburkholderia phytofirmans OLGA172 TaxID=1417228 RepID=A0A160FMT5_9BURK|nr:AlpA family phage regulatory protein [Paraburkholderia phytofirmans]ANB73774.1 AlpA family transcriptional regulator [Paraburkholderia phytofirmans OLGA172]